MILQDLAPQDSHITGGINENNKRNKAKRWNSCSVNSTIAINYLENIIEEKDLDNILDRKRSIKKC